jgi:hypothetical protein
MQHPATSDAGGNVEAIRSRSSLSACGSTWSAAIMARTKGSERMSGKVRRFGPSWHRLLASGFIVSSRVGPRFKVLIAVPIGNIAQVLTSNTNVKRSAAIARDRE